MTAPHSDTSICGPAATKSPIKAAKIVTRARPSFERFVFDDFRRNPLARFEFRSACLSSSPSNALSGEFGGPSNLLWVAK
jgi:hypothetical protein